MNVIEDYLKTFINHQRKKSTSKKILILVCVFLDVKGIFYNIKSQLFINKSIEREKIIWDQLYKKMNMRFFSLKPAFL